MRTQGTITTGLMLIAVLAGCGSETTDSTSAGESTTTTAAPGTTSRTTVVAPTITASAPGTTTRTTTSPPAMVTTTAVPAAPAPTIPRPGAQQAQDLYEGLLQIEPGFAVKDRKKLVSRARDECSNILQGLADDKLIDNAIARFTTPDISAVTKQQGYEIVDLIRAGGWCV